VTGGNSTSLCLRLVESAFNRRQRLRHGGVVPRLWRAPAETYAVSKLRQPEADDAVAAF